MECNENELFETIYTNYYYLISKKLLIITGDKQNLLDLIHDTFIKLMYKSKTLQQMDVNQLTSYILNTSTSVAIDFLRKRKVRNKWNYIAENDSFFDTLLDTTNNPEDELIKNERINELYKVMSLLSDNYRDILMLKYIQELTDAEIAKTFNIKSNSVRQYVLRAKQKALLLYEQK